MLRSPRVVVTILDYNGLRWLPNCLSGVARTDYPNLDVYLVDDGIFDGSLDYVREKFLWVKVKVIQHPTNLGFAEDCGCPEALLLP